MKPTLMVLAAGMGSRYGGLKQLDGLGPAEETIMDYSVYDAIRAGFGKVVFIIRESFAREFEERVTQKFADRIEVVFVYQEVNTPVPGVDQLPERSKPWGTAHAVLV
ncbi:MAG: nucleotidyltransferase, partial [Bacteroidota bacterium]